MRKTLRKIFGIYPGEAKNTLRFARFSIFWAFSTSCFETLVDGLFLSYVGASGLPLVYLLGAIALIGVSSFILYGLRSRSSYQVLRFALTLFFIGSTALLFLFYQTNFLQLPTAFWHGIKIYSLIFTAVFLALAWTFIDHYHDLQDAKRVYSLYSAAYFFGLVISGACINMFLEDLGHFFFFAVSLIFLFLAIREAKTIAQKIPALHDDTTDGAFSGDRQSVGAIIQKLLKSPYTIALLALSLIQQFTITTTEFNYMETFESAFQKGALQKTFTASNVSEFLGKCRAWISFANVLIGGFLYRPFVKRLGLANIVIVPPVFFLLVYLGWMTYDSVSIAVLGLIAVEGVAFTIEDNSFNLLTKAVPAKLRSKVRIVNDSFFEPIGMVISSAVLLFLQGGQSKKLGLAFSIGLIAITFVLRACYKKALFLHLKEHILRFEKTLVNWISSRNRREKKTITDSIIQTIFNSDKEPEILLALEALIALKNVSFIPLIAKKINSLTDSGKNRALCLLNRSFCHRDPKIIEIIYQWADTSSSKEFSQKAYFYLAKRGLCSIETAMDLLEDKHPLWIRGSAILTLKKHPHYQSLNELALYRTIADREIDLLLNDSDEKEVLIGLEILRDIPSIDSAQKALALTHHSSQIVRRESAYVLAKITDKSMYGFAERILQLLRLETDGKTRLFCLEALGKVADSSMVEEILLASTHFRPVEKRFAEKTLASMGLKNVPIILSVLKNSKIPDKPRILASKILARLSLAQLEASLSEILELEKERAYFYFYYGQTIQKNYPSHNLSELTQTLLTSFQSVIDFIIHLLGAVGQVEDPELLVISMHSKNEKVHSSAVEALETTCQPTIFSWIMPLIEDIPFEEKIAAYKKYAGKNKDLELDEILQKLQGSPSSFDRIVSTKLQAKLALPNWRKDLREQLKTCDENFHYFAYELLENETT